MGSAAAATDAPHSGRSSSHDWHSADYVRQWVADNESRAEERRRQFDLVADYVPHPDNAALNILDLGAGWGPVTHRLLTRFPEAHSTLLDFSEEMFAEGRTNLAEFGDRVAYVVADLSKPGGVQKAREAAHAPFDAVVSASFTHNLHDDTRLQELYRELRAVLAPGGCFLNLDNLGSTSPIVQSAWQRGRVEQLRRRRLAETGQAISAQEAASMLEAERRRRFGVGGQQGGQPQAGGDTTPRRSSLQRSVQQHLNWLTDAGFDAVDCFWRDNQRVLIGAYVSPAAT